MAENYEGDAGGYPSEVLLETEATPSPNYVNNLNGLGGTPRLVDSDGNDLVTDSDAGTITVPGGGSSALSVGNTLFVDKDGVDATGTRERFDKPYLTITEATSDSLSGDAIEIRPGTYDERSKGKNGVSLRFAPGTRSTYSGSAIGGTVFDDSVLYGTNGAIDCTIEGDVFDNLGTDAEEPAANDKVTAVINMTHADSVLRFRANRVGSDTEPCLALVPCLINQMDGRLIGDIDEMYGAENAYGIYWWTNGGPCNLNVKKIIWTSTASPPVTTAVSAAPTGEFYLELQEISSPYYAFSFQDTHNDTRVWIMHPASIIGGAAAIIANVGLGAQVTTARYYIIGGGKITATSASCNVIELTTGIHWYDFQKLTVPANGATGIKIHQQATIADLKLMELETLGVCTNIVSLNQASSTLDLSIQKCRNHASAGGILVSAGTLRLSNCPSIDTSLNSSTSPLNGAAGVTIEICNVHLHAHATAASITNVTGSGTLTVKCKGACSANRPVGSNVTIIGTLNYDPSL